MEGHPEAGGQDSVDSDGRPDFDDEIDETSSESFPASDAPQWWSGPSGPTTNG